MRTLTVLLASLPLAPAALACINELEEHREGLLASYVGLVTLGGDSLIQAGLSTTVIAALGVFGVRALVLRVRGRR